VDGIIESVVKGSNAGIECDSVEVGDDRVVGSRESVGGAERVDDD
jgi:hypothetical protein